MFNLFRPKTVSDIVSPLRKMVDDLDALNAAKRADVDNFLIVASEYSEKADAAHDAAEEARVTRDRIAALLSGV